MTPRWKIRTTPLSDTTIAIAPSRCEIDAAREMPAAKSQRQIDLLDRGIQIATCGDHEPRFGDHERTIELREFLDRASQVWIADVCPPGCMASQGIENQRPRRREDGILGAKREERADAAAFTAFTRDLQGQLDGLLEDSWVAPGNDGTQLLENGNRHSPLSP